MTDGPIPAELNTLRDRVTAFRTCEMDAFDARPCFKCGRKITACFGFCKAGDLVEILEGRRTLMPRELCGLCVEFWQWNADSELEPNPLPFDGFLERVEQ